MFAKVYSATLLGLDCELIEIEVDYSHGLSNFTIVGLGDKAVQEAKDRVLTSLRNIDPHFIPKRITINLAPANLAKSGSNFDLGIIAGLLLAMQKISFDPQKLAFVGELSLDGKVRSVRGVLPLVHGLKQMGFGQVFVPEQNLAEIATIEGIQPIGISSIQNLLDYTTGKWKPPLALGAKTHTTLPSFQPEFDFADIYGQFKAKRALEVAAVSKANILMTGAPGVGKTLLAKSLVGIIPELREQEKFDVLKIHSVTGEATDFFPDYCPFRAPHHTSSKVALIGGGAQPSPGEITLAHQGVLFLDELAEFSRSTLESLRQPLEDGTVTIARASYKVSYPAKFMLVAAMNPCRCGMWGQKHSTCKCTEYQVQNYQKRISTPLLDRIPIHFYVEKAESAHLGKVAESSAAVRKRVEKAQKFYQETYGVFPGDLPPLKLEPLLHKRFSNELRLLRMYIEKLGASMRSYHNCLQLAVNISTLELSALTKVHIAEALSYRNQ